MQLSQTEIALRKAELRKALLEKRKQVPLSVAKDIGKEICERIFEYVLQSNPRAVLLYSPVRGETDVMPLCERLWEHGFCVAFPISHKESTTLEFRIVTDASQLSLGAYNIPEPNDTCDVLTAFEDALCIVPALAMSRSGIRLGYGKGYYDRFLADKHIATACPLYSDFLSDTLPSYPTDALIDIIFTEKEVIFSQYEN